MSLEKALKQSPELKQAYDTEEVTRKLIDTHSFWKTSRATLPFTQPASSSRSAFGQSAPPQAGRRRHDRDPIPYGAGRRPGIAEDGFPRPENAHRDSDTCEMVKKTRGIEVPVDSLPLDDAKAYDCLIRQTPSAFSSLNPAGCGTCAGGFRSVPSNTSRH